MASDDYAKATGSPSSIRINGSEYRVSKFTPRDIGDLQQWLKEQIPDPKVEARKLLEGLPDAVAIEIWKTQAEAAKDWPPTIGDDRAQDLLVTTSEGSARLLWVTLRKHNQVDLEKARALAQEAEIETIQQVVRLASP